MNAPAPLASSPPPHGPDLTVGCVSYLNAKPLIHGLPDRHTRVIQDVPSRLIQLLRDGDCDVALCSIVDACRDPERLAVLPVGGIGCAGPTWTVRLFSRVPIAQLQWVHLDADSHTSVMLLRVLLAERFGITPQTVDTDFRQQGGVPKDAQAALLIGDKVVTHPPDPEAFPHTLDLGQAWNAWTGLPFVFAAWITRRETAERGLGDLPERLIACRQRNLATPQAIDTMLDAYAETHGWPRDLARDYWTQILRYAIEPDDLQAIRRYAQACRQLLDQQPALAPLGPIHDPTFAHGPQPARA